MRRPIRPEHRSLPLSAWPAFDRAAWAAAIDPGSALRDPGRGAHWRPATRERYLWAYGHWLAFIRHSAPERLAKDPAERIGQASAQAFIESLRARTLASRSQATYLEALHNAAWAMFPDRDWSWLRELVNWLVRHAVPKKIGQERLWPIDNVYKAGVALMERALRMTPKRPLQDLIWFRDGLMVAMLAACPLRRRNFANLRLGHHLVRERDGYRVNVPGDEVKNGQAIEGELPARLTPWIDRFLADVRPRLLQGRATDSLWICQDGRPFTVGTLSLRVWKVTNRLGYPMRPHDFRSAAATTIATAAPELARSIAHLLGHKQMHTAERYYNKATMLDASRRHTATIAELRRSLACDTPIGTAER